MSREMHLLWWFTDLLKINLRLYNPEGKNKKYSHRTPTKDKRSELQFEMIEFETFQLQTWYLPVS